MTSPIIMEILLLGEEGQGWLAEMAGIKMRCRPCRHFFSLKYHLGAVRIFPLIEQIPSDTACLPLAKPTHARRPAEDRLGHKITEPSSLPRPKANGDKATWRDSIQATLTPEQERRLRCHCLLGDLKCLCLSWCFQAQMLPRQNEDQGERSETPLACLAHRGDKSRSFKDSGVGNH